MFKLSSIVSLLILPLLIFGQSPHGDGLKIKCEDCHNANSWEIDFDDFSFNHDSSTHFPLEGQHSVLDCKLCHSTLIFEEAESNCISCHTDMHEQTVGQDCARCHDATSWLVNNISEIHQENGFPLLGVHVTVNCFDCHQSESRLRFDPIGHECINCHQDDYYATTNPNHQDAAYSLDCQECHNIYAFEWKASGINHDFFPLTNAHDISDCTQCHSSGDYSATSSDCYACHQVDYEAAVNPNHLSINLSINCIDCHTTDPDWMPAEFLQHDTEFFPIYSGKHNGEWDGCADCHTNGDNYAEFTCTSCHMNPETDEEHEEVQGYIYESTACLACHPTGDEENVFNHNATNFPLTGAHLETACVECHTTSYAGTPTQCDACHLTDYNATTNPNHMTLELALDCASCHTTDPDWIPAAFPIHNDFYPLNGAHAIIANDCASCHDGDFSNTPNTCLACHQSDYDQTIDPSHQDLQFSTDCLECHTENAWEPSTYDHDLQHFPIYSGAHMGEWTACVDCHSVPGDYSQFTCVSCHANPETDDEHSGINGYVYENSACLACHPTGESDVNFDHNMTDFPLTGAHIDTDCISCHTNGYEGTPMQCEACHSADYNTTTNPNHLSLGLPMDCATCHTTEPEWNPASFPNHDDYYPLNGAHAAIATDCSSCHNGDYNNTPNTCNACHASDYDQATNPDHSAAQFPRDCESCHTEDSWIPATFDHDGQYFPIYSGSHAGEWDQCMQCHTNTANYAEVNCINCHSNPETDEEHTGIDGYIYNSTACLACHPTGEGNVNFDHNMTDFPLTGAHIDTDCLSCHGGGFVGTPIDCESCHSVDYNTTTNPNHQSLGLPMDCASCHTTDPEWNPAAFPNHDDYYPLNGAHIAISTDCITCHNGDYNNTPNTCNGCHSVDYDQTNDPDHTAAQFPRECQECHTEDAWTPASFDHDGQYFPIYSGSHQGEWDQCLDCHTNLGNFSEFTCTTCHIASETDPEHSGVNGYVFNSSACLACHPTGEGNVNFNHNSTDFPLTGAHVQVDCIECHSAGYVGTPTDCSICHTEDFNASANPNHSVLGISTDCASCHTTEPDWIPAQFPIHDDYYPLTGAHVTIASDCAVCHNGDYNNTPNTCSACHTDDYNQTANPNHITLGLPTDCAMCHTTEPEWNPAAFPDHDSYYALNGVHASIANDCIQCHNGDYSNTPNTCMGCHIADYNQTNDPDHQAAQFPTTCENCHSEDTWTPASWDHDGMYFPIYSGSHQGEWDQCLECHTNPGNFSEFTCTSCHIASETDPEHNGVNGYVFNSSACLACHPTGEGNVNFDHNSTNFPLTGAHIQLDCIECHASGYPGTPTDCAACHSPDYDASTNPNHQSLGLPMDCESCHTPEPDWMPASFPNHDDYYALTGAHLSIATECIECHNGDYNNTPNTCAGCHTADYDASTNPDHQSLGLPMDCESCHTPEPDWMPASFPNHDDYYALSGAHLSIASECAECHNGDYNNTSNTCVGCHMDDYDQSSNPDHAVLAIPTDCEVCHTTVPDWVPASFPIHDNYYPLTGAHTNIANDCATCHNGDYNNTPNTCAACHIDDYNQTTNPDHVSIGIPNDCEMCHTTEPEWNPAGFPIHDDYYPLNGAHAVISNDCILCHDGDYNNTPNTCFGCHADDYNQTTDPDHQSAQFPTSCESCHTEDAWTPANWDHDGMYFPIYSGNHEGEWDQCIDCHTIAGNYTLFSCIDCHEHDDQAEVDDDHSDVSGYSYSSPACYSCHPNGD